MTEPLCRLEVARLQDTSCLRWAVSGVWGALLWSTPVHPPHDTGSGHNFSLFPSSNSSAVTPKLPQANGTHVPRSSEGQHSPSDSDRE